MIDNRQSGRGPLLVARSTSELRVFGLPACLGRVPRRRRSESGFEVADAHGATRIRRLSLRGR